MDLAEEEAYVCGGETIARPQQNTVQRQQLGSCVFWSKKSICFLLLLFFFSPRCFSLRNLSSSCFSFPRAFRHTQSHERRRRRRRRGGGGVATGVWRRRRKVLQVRVSTILKVEPRNLKQKIQMGKDSQFANPPRIIRQIPYLFPPPPSSPLSRRHHS